MTQPVNCPYFFGDYHRGRRARKVSPDRTQPRKPAAVAPRAVRFLSCAGHPGETTCAHLALEASVERKLGLFDRVSVYAVCTEHLTELKDPKRCPQCEAARGK